nr:hypothetical protein BN993_03517 [Virgibacillus halodenitrificans]
MRIISTPVMRLTLLGAAMLLVSGCSSGPVQQSVTTYLNCDDLEQAVASASNGFDDIKRGGRSTRYGQDWNTRVQAFENACSIVSTTGKAYYTCSGRIETGADELQLEAATESIGQCLGPDWVPRTATTGEVAFRRTDGAGPLLTLKSFTNDRGSQMVVMRIDQP